MFVRFNDSFVCPQISLNPPSNAFQRIRNSFIGIKSGALVRKGDYALLYGLRKLYCWWLWRKECSILDMKKYVPYKAGTYYWIIPAEYVTDLVEGEIAPYKIPIETEKYLTFRYGNWRVPQRDWNTLRDDKSIVPCQSEDLDEIIKLYN